MRRLRRMTMLASLVALAGCGDGQREFSAEDLIEEANANGAGLELGAPLEVSREDAEVLAVAFVETGEQHAEEAEHHEHSGGTLTITADADDGLDEYERCESAATLLCFRASNAVLFFESMDPDDRQGLEEALRAMASEE